MVENANHAAAGGERSMEIFADEAITWDSLKLKHDYIARVSSGMGQRLCMALPPIEAQYLCYSYMTNAILALTIVINNRLETKTVWCVLLLVIMGSLQPLQDNQPIGR